VTQTRPPVPDTGDPERVPAAIPTQPGQDGSPFPEEPGVPAAARYDYPASDGVDVLTEPDDRPPAPAGPLPLLVRWWVRSDALLYLLSALFATLAMMQAMDLWGRDLTAPFVYGNDATAVLAHFKTVMETGWYEYQPMLGAPAGQAYHDFPQADNLHMMAAVVLGLFSSNVAVVVNLYYLIGFPLAAVTGAWFFRTVGVSKVMTLVLAVLFAISPFHWEKNENHLFLAAYFPVPLALGVVIWALRGEPLWTPGKPRPGLRGRLRPFTGRGAAVTAIMVLLGTASSYFGFFGLLMLGTAAIVSVARLRNWRRFAGVIAAGTVLAGTMLANMLPDILYSLRFGNNESGLVRSGAQTEYYSLKLAQLLLPYPGHPWQPLADLREYYDTAYPIVSEHPALGFVAAIGFVGLVFFLVIRLGSLARSERTISAHRQRLRETYGYLALLTLVAFLFSTLGGFESLISLVNDNLRSWNRLVIMIMAFCLGAVGLAVDGVIRRRQPKFGVARSRLLAGLVAAAVMIVGVWDQSTTRAIPQYDGVANAWRTDKTWINALETALPDGAMILQLDYQPFPEGASVNGVIYTDVVKPYVHSTTLRWSGGGIQGRARSDWSQLVADEPPAQIVADAAVAGFEGIMVDRRTYGDNGSSTEAGLAAALRTGGPTMVSANGRYTYFSLAPERTRLETTYSPAERAAAAAAVLQPVRLNATRSFDQSGGQWTTRSIQESLLLDNARSTPVPIKLSVVLSSPTGASQVMLTSGEDSWVVNLSATAASAVTIDMTAPAGRTELVVGPGPDATGVNDDTRFSLSNASVQDLSRRDLSAGR
jgi:hypothetical protein